MKKVIKDHPCSKLWLEDGYVYKWQPKHLTENEIWCLEKMHSSDFVPYAERVELEVIKMEFVEEDEIFDVALLQDFVAGCLNTLMFCGIRHGDLTRPNILIRDNKPIIIDFAESRLMTDPRPDKRPEGDEYWLRRTIEEIINGRA